MTIEEVKSRLCCYDQRNPYALKDEDDSFLPLPENCYCDNCFYGRTRMAEYVLTILDRNAELLEALIASKDHLEYCGYGDAWEREAAMASRLEEQIEKAITNTTKPTTP